jgi:hypothetical protein
MAAQAFPFNRSFAEGTKRQNIVDPLITMGARCQLSLRAGGEINGKD